MSETSTPGEARAKRGIVYIATGERFIQEASLSAESVKSVMPETPITLMTDTEVEYDIFDDVVHIEGPRYDFGDQVSHLEQTPYDRTIFLDSDIYLDNPIDDLFDVLDEFDLAAAHNQRNYSSKRVDMDAIEAIPECFPEYNSGVVAFETSPRVMEFFDQWQEVYNTVRSRGQKHNQAAFRLALYRSDLRIATLPLEYNCVFRRPGCVNGPVKVFHGRLISVEGPGASLSVDVEQAVTELNSSTDLRSYYRIGDTVRLAKPTLFERVKRSLRRNGVLGTMKRIPRFLGCKLSIIKK